MQKSGRYSIIIIIMSSSVTGLLLRCARIHKDNYITPEKSQGLPKAVPARFSKYKLWFLTTEKEGREVDPRYPQRTGLED